MKYQGRHLPLEIDRNIDAVCDEFEAQWASGKTPSIEELLADRTGPERSALLGELLRIELSYRIERGHMPGEDEYGARFPEDAELVRRVLGPEVPITRGPEFTSDRPASERSVGLDDSSDSSAPARFGRYEVVTVLGKGAFGTVYLANDSELRRWVAVKVPTFHLPLPPQHMQQYMAEAQIVAGLDHPHIVPVHDVGQTDDGRCYVVSKFISGTDLREVIERRRPSHRESAEIVITVAEALHFAHKQRLVHRDVKPANILIDETGQPHLTDFGMALRDEEYGTGGLLVGTPAYMSPEQARGEGHRVDGRSDIFSLGLVLYELLTGVRAFHGSNSEELLEHIKSFEARPPRQIDDTIPKDLERICLKALSKRAMDRYTTARDMAEDLQSFLSREATTRAASIDTSMPATAGQSELKQTQYGSPAAIIPKGLRSFDGGDSDFFLELLPGPWDREGIPENLRFWKSRIEETDPDRTFRVGLIYGPSGCGKSSLVKAGLLPRLGNHVMSVYVEATAEDTEARLLRGLHRHCGELPADLSLSQTVAALRRGQGSHREHKVLVVLDQFEQWLHAANEYGESELVHALRHCDGERVQCLVLLRDDFWMAVTRFMRQLEVHLAEGENSASVDLFDSRHARSILEKFGQAFGRLPASLAELSNDQESFLVQAIASLAEQGKVICARLALFAEMVKDKPWTVETLKAIGGAEGVGVAFLEETFSSPAAPPEHRLHQRAARSVMQKLLPENGRNIRGELCSESQLLEASGYRERPTDFADLLRILDSETRLLTPVDPAAAADEQTTSPSPGEKHYQLTNDYLVAPLREWLNRKQRETWRGRAVLRLAERAADWNAKPRTRYLPSWWEFLNIRCLVPTGVWSEPQKKMMRTAANHHGLRSAFLVLLACVMSVAGFWIRDHVREAQDERHAGELVSRLLHAEITNVSQIVQDLSDFRLWADPLLRMQYQSADSSDRQLRAAVGLLPVDRNMVDFLLARLLESEPAEYLVLRDVLGDHQEAIVEPLWQKALNADEARRRRFHAACALAMYDAQDTRWKRVQDDVAAELVSVNSIHVGIWTRALRDVRMHLIPALSRIFHDQSLPDSIRYTATNILADYAADQPSWLVRLILDSDPQQFAVLFPRLTSHQDFAVDALKHGLSAGLWGELNVDHTWPPLSAEELKTIESADGLVTESFALCQTLPLEQLESLCDALLKSGYRLRRLRPYDASDSEQVAVIWVRNGQRSHYSVNQTADDILRKNEQLQVDGYMPSDICGYAITKQGELQDRYAAIWSQPLDRNADARLLVGLSQQKYLETFNSLKDGYSPAAFSLFKGADGAGRYSAVWLRRNGASTARSITQVESGKLLIKNERDRLPNVDLQLVGIDPPTRDALCQALLRQVANQLAKDPGNVEARITRIQALFYQGRIEDCLGEINELLDMSAEHQTLLDRKDHLHLLAFRAVSLARLGDSEKALADYGACQQQGAEKEQLAYLDGTIAAYLNRSEKGLARLEKAIDEDGGNSQLLFDAACIYAITHGLAAERGNRSDQYVRRAAELLKEAVARDSSNSELLVTEPDFEPIRRHPHFRELLGKYGLSWSFGGAWSDRESLISIARYGDSPQQHLDQCRTLVRDGYRPIAISVLRTDPHMAPVSASLWHATEEELEQVASQKANAAIVLLKYGQYADMRAVLQASARPDAQSHFVERASDFGLIADTIAERLREETTPGIRRALILTLGGFDRQSMSDDQREALFATLVQFYRDELDPGVHGAAEWLLRLWGQSERRDEVDRALASSQIKDNARWYVDGQGHTMVIIPAPGEVWLGSHGGDGNIAAAEQLRREQIGHSFAISTKEVTKQQFRQFDSRFNHEQLWRSPENDCPILGVSWYRAAEYCNWLSRVEGISRDQWCFVLNDQGKLVEASDFLKRSGFRLPTEAEWEYACRAGTETSRYYGYSDELLDQYAWVGSKSPTTLRVASLKPNGLGLFDMFGNAVEWCQDRYGNDAAREKTEEDAARDQPEASDGQEQRALRGGSFLVPVWDIRVSFRGGSKPTINALAYGFRVARTHKTTH